MAVRAQPKATPRSKLVAKTTARAKAVTPRKSVRKSSAVQNKKPLRKQSAPRSKAATGANTPMRKRPARKQSQMRLPPFSLELTPQIMNWLAGGAMLTVLAGAVLWIGIWINNPENLSIQRVDWQSEFQYLEKSELQAVVEPYVSTNLYLLDEVGLEQALEAYPWIRAVSLRKAWPDQLFLNVEEQMPIAFWGENHLMNQFGEIFPAELDEKIGEFPMMYSPKNNGREMAERYVELAKSLQGLGVRIVELTENDNGSWKMKLNDGQDVIIGRKEHEKRIKRFRVGYMQELRSKFDEIRTIDLRYTNGFAIEWKRGSAGAGAVSSLGQGQTLGNRGS